MEDEWEEEEQLVVAELSGVIDSDMLCQHGGVCKIVGMSSEQPVVQVGRYLFAGEYEDALGTCVVFEEQTKDRTKSDSGLAYKCHTTKKLVLQRTFLSERKEGEESSGGIEILSLNDGEIRGRSNTVCHYGMEQEEPQRLDAGADISAESEKQSEHSVSEETILSVTPKP